MSASSPPPRWWLSPLLFTICFVAALATALHFSETAREVLPKAFGFLTGALATPFILESSIALFGLTLVLVINQWRLQKQDDEWVLMEVKDPTPKSPVTTPAVTPTSPPES